MSQQIMPTCFLFYKLYKFKINNKYIFTTLQSLNLTIVVLLFSIF